MTSYLKEIMDAMGSRLRSPFFGSIAVVFVISNWKPLFYLVFSSEPVSVRLRFFDLNTDEISLYLLPFGLGMLIAVIAPWLKYAGAIIAAQPTRRLRALHDEEAIERKIADLGRQARLEEAQAAEENAKERRLIEAAKRDREVEDLGDDELEKEIAASREDRDSLRSGSDISQVSERTMAILVSIAASPQGFVVAYEHNNAFKVNLGGRETSVQGRRDYLKLLNDLKQLTENGLLEKEDSDTWKMTQAGYEAVEQFTSQSVS
ncbi:MAG: hypothetical protein P8X77_10585 [Maritimibacter sp.]